MKMLGVVAVVALGAAAPARSAQDVDTVAVQLTVLERRDLFFDRTALMFPAARPAGGAVSALELDAVSNSGAGWGVFLQADPLTHADGVTQIPAESFQYSLTGAAPVPRGVPLQETMIYETGPESPISRLKLDFQVSAPAGQKAGRYSTTLRVMVVDNL